MSCFIYKSRFDLKERDTKERKYNTNLFTFLPVQKNDKNAQIAVFQGRQCLNVTENGLSNYNYIG